MNKEERIAKYGEAAYEKKLERDRAYYKAHKEEERARAKKYYEEHPEEAKAAAKKWREDHPEEVISNNKKYREEHPEQVKAHSQEGCKKGGKYYDKKLAYKHTGIQGDKNVIRAKHVRDYKPYKDIIAPESQIHHEWIPKTADYRGMALVEADAHQYGIIDVIEILDGKITLLTEEEVKSNKEKEKMEEEILDFMVPGFMKPVYKKEEIEKK